MNCVEAEKYFADLLDDNRDERLRKVNDHLAACARCRQESAALAACQQLVSALPQVEPPEGFTTRVMAEVRDAAHRPNIWQRLFSPMQKLPLQATAVVLISVVAVLIYQKESGHRERTTSPRIGLQKQAELDKLPRTAARAPALKPEAQNLDKAGAQELKVRPSPQTEQPRSPAEPEQQSNIIDGIEAGAPNVGPPPASGNSASVAPSQPKKESSSADQAGSVRPEQSLRSGGAQARRVTPSVPLQDNNTAAQDRTSGAQSPSSAGLEEKGTRSSLGALGSSTGGADRDLIFRFKEPARVDRSREASSELQRSQAGPSPSQAQFKELDQGRRRAIETGQPQTVWAMIDASQYNEFKKELAGLGNIESELPAPAHKHEVKRADQLRIKLTILPPNYSAQPPTR